MTEQELNFENEVRKHQQLVSKNISNVIVQLISRAKYHDDTKFKEVERDLFVKNTEKLSKMVYGSEDYIATLEQMKPAIHHHHAFNRHHPEHYEHGIKEMNLIDVVEMFCDWLAAVERHETGDIYKSLQINRKRFNMSVDLYQILLNTANSMA